MSYPRLAFYLVTIVALGLLALFLWQNSLRTVEMTFDLGFKAWRLPGPVPVVWTVVGAFATGGILGAAFFMQRASAANRRVRQLEQQLAVSDTGGSEYK